MKKHLNDLLARYRAYRRDQSGEELVAWFRWVNYQMKADEAVAAKADGDYRENLNRIAQLRRMSRSRQLKWARSMNMMHPEELNVDDLPRILFQCERVVAVIRTAPTNQED